MRPARDNVRAERANAPPVFFIFRNFRTLRHVWSPEARVRRRGLSGKSVRAVEGARLESVYTSKGYRGFESRLFRQISERSVKSPAEFRRGLFVCMRPANGVNPRRRCILRRESYGRRAGPRRDPAARGSVRPIPDHTSAAGPAAGTRVESIRTFFRHCFSGLPENGSWPRPPGTVHAGQSVRILVFPIRAEKGIFSCRAFYKIQAQYLNVSATDREKIS